MFSAQSKYELKRAVNDCCRDGISSEDNRLAKLHGPIGKWDVSQVTDMSSLFHGFKYFNYTLFDWDVSQVTDMSGMFYETHSFNQDLSKWDVSRVTDMSGMFFQARDFNQDLSKWDVSRVVGMELMFLGATSFQQTLCGEAWVNSKASKVNMFIHSPGIISDTVCGT